MDTLQDRIESTVKTHRLFEKGSPCVLMVSGGSDSVAMLDLICDMRERLGLGELLVVHVNHGLRGSDADLDEAFVCELANFKGVDIRVAEVDIAAMAASEGGNIEAVARRERYTFAQRELDVLCARNGVDPEEGRILVAHTRNDRVETFYMRSIVGTGPGGLSGMTAMNGRVVRPLFDLDREELRAYLEDLGKRGLSALWREDETNADTEHFRSFVRHAIVPVAKRFNPNLNTTLCRTMDLIAEENDMLDGTVAAAELRAVSTEDDGTLLIDREVLTALDAPLQRRILVQVAKRILPPDIRIEGFHVDDLMECLHDSTKAILLPTGIRVGDEYGRLAFQLDHPGELPVELDLGVRLEVPGDVDCGVAGTLVSFPQLRGLDPDVANDNEATISLDEVDELWVTGIHEGDRMQPLGMGGNSKKVSDILIDRKIPKRSRAAIPVVRAGSPTGERIVWLVGVCLSEEFKVTPRTVKTALLSME